MGLKLLHSLVGNQVVVTATFSVAGVPTDPTSVTFRVRAGRDGPVASYGGGAAEVSNPEVGTWELALDADEAGTWGVRVEGTGACAAAAESAFVVDASTVV